MSSYALSLWFLFAAVASQALACGLALECSLRKGLASGRRGMWLLFGLSALASALHSSYAFQFALQTSIYDLRQASLTMMAGIVMALAIRQLRLQVDLA